MNKLIILAILWLLFALVPWLPEPSVWLWKFAVLVTGLGPWFALLTLIFIFVHCKMGRPWMRSHWRWWVILGLNVLSLMVFLNPLISVVKHEADWQNEVARAFGPSDVATKKTPRWLHWTNLFLGSREEPIIPQTLEYANPAGQPLMLDYYPPHLDGSQPTKAPWVLVIHGGGWSSGNPKQLPELNSHLARHGYGVIATTYRLAPKWQWPTQEIDIAAAVAFVKAHATDWNLDPDRWAILGRSAGGQIAGSVAYRADGNATRPRGLISIYAPTDLYFGYEAGEEDDALGSRQLLRDYLGGTPYDQEDRYSDATVLHRLSKASCPTLILHGLGDQLVWVKHAERLYYRLKKLGVPAALIELPRGPHGYDFFFSSPEAQVATGAIDEFLQHVLRKP